MLAQTARRSREQPLLLLPFARAVPMPADVLRPERTIRIGTLAIEPVLSLTRQITVFPLLRL